MKKLTAIILTVVCFFTTVVALAECQHMHREPLPKVYNNNYGIDKGPAGHLVSVVQHAKCLDCQATDLPYYSNFEIVPHSLNRTYDKTRKKDHVTCRTNGCDYDDYVEHKHVYNKNRIYLRNMNNKDRVSCACGSSIITGHVHVFVQKYTTVNGKKKPTWKECACGQRR